MDCDDTVQEFVSGPIRIVDTIRILLDTGIVLVHICPTGSEIMRIK